MNDILQKTYDILDAKGWCQGVHQNADGQVCLEGAFALASGGFSYTKDAIYANMSRPETQAAWKQLCDTVKAEIGDLAPYVWNDRPSTTVEDVKLILKKAIHG